MVAVFVPFLVAETGNLTKITEGRTYLAPWLRVESIAGERHGSRSLR